MGPIKRILKSDRVRNALCWIGAQYIRLVYATSRWQVINGGHAQSQWDQGKPFILAFWHGRILLMPYCWRRTQPINMLISQHRDGQIIAQTVSHFGIATVAGSSSKGGSAALRQMLKSLKNGECVGITPDGPRGPRMRASEGIAQVARMAGVPVIPCGFSTVRRKVLGSWDRFIVAWPFTRGVFVWGDPLVFPQGGDADQFRLQIEAELNRITGEADRLTGHAPVEPAPLPDRVEGRV